MWEFLKTKARKEIDRVGIEQAKKNAELEYLESLRLYSVYELESKRLHKKMEVGNKKHIESDKVKVDKLNNVCPKCGSTKVVDKISQLKGEINGSSFGYYGYSHGSIHGTMDTLEINKCNDCTNEWKKNHYSQYGRIDMETEMRHLKIGIQNVLKFTTSKDGFIEKRSKEFWAGTKLEILPLLIEKEYLGYISDYIREEMYKVIKDQDEILINNFGFVR